MLSSPLAALSPKTLLGTRLWTHRFRPLAGCGLRSWDGVFVGDTDLGLIFGGRIRHVGLATGSWEGDSERDGIRCGMVVVCSKFVTGL